MTSFLNTLLPEKHQIQDLQYSRNEQQGYTALNRKAILHELQDIPPVMHEAVFLKLFDAAQIACFDPVGRRAYEVRPGNLHVGSVRRHSRLTPQRARYIALQFLEAGASKPE